MQILGLARSLNKCVGKVDGLAEYGIDVVGLDCSEEASGYISIGASVLAAAAGAKVIQVITPYMMLFTFTELFKTLL